jgi:3-hydroxybutyryl-CoA dehydrogenase
MGKKIEKIAVIGAGKMGSGIGLEFACYGHPVVLQSRHDSTLDNAMRTIREYLDLMTETEMITANVAEKALNSIRTTKDMAEAVKGADHIVESVSEDLALKQDIFAKLDDLCPPEVSLATNSSTMRAEDCALKSTKYPERILITHYWHPAPFIPLVEVIGSKRTAPDVLERTAALLRGMHKRVVLQSLELPAGPAGWGNALQQPMENVARKLVDEKGCDPRIVDDLIKFGFGRRLSFAAIFMRYDLTGLDFFYDAAKARGNEPWGPIKERVERNETGAKSGKGFYDWPGDSAAKFNRYFNIGLIQMLKQDIERGEI